MEISDQDVEVLKINMAAHKRLAAEHQRCAAAINKELKRRNREAACRMKSIEQNTTKASS